MNQPRLTTWLALVVSELNRTRAEAHLDAGTVPTEIKAGDVGAIGCVAVMGDDGCIGCLQVGGSPRATPTTPSSSRDEVEVKAVNHALRVEEPFGRRGRDRTWRRRCCWRRGWRHARCRAGVKGALGEGKGGGRRDWG